MFDTPCHSCLQASISSDYVFCVCEINAKIHCVVYCAFSRNYCVLLHCNSYEPPQTHLHMVGMLRFVSFNINQLSFPTPFYSVLGICFCLYGPFNCISFLKFPFSRDKSRSGWLGSKHWVAIVMAVASLLVFVPLTCCHVPFCLCVSAVFSTFIQNATKWRKKKKKKKKKHPVDKFLACLFLGMHHMHGCARPRTALRLSGLPRPVPSSPGNMWPGTCWSVQRGFAESDPPVKHHHTAWPRRRASRHKRESKTGCDKIWTERQVGCLSLSIELLLPAEFSSDQFSSRQYLDAWGGPLVLRPISQRFPQCSLSSGSVSEF